MFTKSDMDKIRGYADRMGQAGAIALGKENEWYRQKWRALKRERGNMCHICGARENLQFAHIHETGLSGWGRGFNHRVLDVMNHPKSYLLLCEDCHQKLDHRNVGVKNERERETDTDDTEKTYFD
jgi:hypothetical protein